MEVTMSSKQFTESMAILQLVEDLVTKLQADLANDGKISILEWVGLAFTGVSEGVSVALNAGDVVADQMSGEELMQIVSKLAEVGKLVAGLFSK